MAKYRYRSYYGDKDDDNDLRMANQVYHDIVAGRELIVVQDENIRAGTGDYPGNRCREFRT